MGTKWNGLVWCGAVAAALVCLGCRSVNTIRADASLDVSEMLGPVTRTYVISAIYLPERPVGPRRDTAPGFNLDGMVTGRVVTPANCQEEFPDFTADTGEVGVDNLFTGGVASLAQSIGDTDFQRDLDEQIACGRFILALTLRDIHSFHNDSSVTFDVALVKPADCLIESCQPVGGIVRGGQMWTVTAPIASGLAARILDGHFRGTVPALGLTLTLGGAPLPLTIRDVIVGGDISTTSLEDGAIGGGLRIDDIVTGFRSEPDLARYADVVAGILPDYGDLEPSETDLRECLSISIGLGLTAVDGTLTGS